MSLARTPQSARESRRARSRSNENADERENPDFKQAEKKFMEGL